MSFIGLDNSIWLTILINLLMWIEVEFIGLNAKESRRIYRIVYRKILKIIVLTMKERVEENIHKNI
jgi:hypothetical protein